MHELSVKTMEKLKREYFEQNIHVQYQLCVSRTQEGSEKQVKDCTVDTNHLIEVRDGNPVYVKPLGKLAKPDTITNLHLWFPSTKSAEKVMAERNFVLMAVSIIVAFLWLSFH